MGKVFMWEEIRDGRVPSLDSFEQTVAMIHHRLTDSPLIGGVIGGSVNYGTHSVRSDIDCLMLYPEESRTQMQEAFAELILMAEELYVPLDIAQLTPELAITCNHDITPSFANHLRNAVRYGGVVKQDPFRHMELRPLDRRVEAGSWVRHKIRGLDEGAIRKFDNEQEARFLQKLLEAPIHAMRKLLLVDRHFEDDSKGSVLTMAHEIHPDLVEELQRLVRIDAAYSVELQAQLNFPNESAYNEVLWAIREEREAVNSFLQKVGIRLQEV